MTTETLKSVTTPDGATIRYTDAGAGDPPIVFVHGWTCDHTTFLDQLAHFAPTNRVVALDQRGHGASDKPDQDYNVPGFVEDLAWFISELGLDRPVVVGHSMGGSIALNFARRHTALTRGVILIDSPLAPLPDALLPVREAMLAGFKSDAYQSVAAGFARTQFFNADSPPAMVEALVAKITCAPQRLMHTAIDSTISAESMVPGPIPVPSLYIRAATAYATEDQVRERYPGLEVHTVESAHFIQMEKPTETNALIAAFLEKLG